MKEIKMAATSKVSDVIIQSHFPGQFSGGAGGVAGRHGATGGGAERRFVGRVLAKRWRAAPHGAQILKNPADNSATLHAEMDCIS